MGFVLTPDEAATLIAKDERNRQVLFPYLNGEDLNSRPDQSPSRWAINFFTYPLERIDEKEWSLLTQNEKEQQAKLGRVAPDYSKPVARDFPDCIAILEEKVKPEREAGSKFARKEWWIYHLPRPKLYETISKMEKVLAVSRVSKFFSIVFVNTGVIFNDRLVVITSNQNSVFSILQNTFHEQWMLVYGTSHETRPTYMPPECFETFPFPELTDELEEIGAQYHEFRREIMLNRQEGLTQTYNRFHNERESAPDIARLRELHIAMDSHVKLAYGWQDLELAHGFHETKQGVRFTISPEARQEVLDRLLELNFARHAEELKSGLWEKPKASKKGGKKTKSAEPETKDGKPLRQGGFGFLPEQDSLF